MSIFLDTNIIIYAFLEDHRQAAARICLEQDFVISAQVLNEFVNVMHKKYRLPWDKINEAKRIVCNRAIEILPLNKETNDAATLIAQIHKTSFYDALIISIAIEADCSELLSEDMQHGRTFGRLRVTNPFL